MTLSDDRRQAWLDGMAQHVLAHGLNNASLRPLAQAVGTSDRMLIYHFGSKEGLIDALLRHLAGGFVAGLEAALPPGRAASLPDCLAEVVALLRNPAMAGYARVWLDILSAAAGGDAAHRQAGQDIMAGFALWLEGRLPEGTAQPAAVAEALLTLLEGVIVMDSIGQQGMADAAVAMMGQALLNR
ncbi:MAG: TetR/AcrR family transcriptional regulator [Rhodobacterales bacterium]|nr:TetR/AcrR family transcriptional regulator [Rhodobacterales bacterium]MDX5391349.1 TetR/AcrR family transcriptional regulator [Rhodobacterales bacterium]MDX5491050.1 TetR/AcrR family transcriptional regulator [Rhodobacterales bacterium]